MARKLPIVGKAAKKGATGWAALQLAERAITPVRTRTRKTTLFIAGAAGAAGVWFLDPEQGKRRRHEARDRALALVRRGKQQTLQKADYVAGHAQGAVQEAGKRVVGEEPKPDVTDQSLARKVETVIFRDGEVPKGKIDVDAAGSTVWLRGEADTPEMIKELEKKASDIPEVEKVENLLHLPGTPAPTRADTPESQRQDTTQPEAPRQPEPAEAVTGEQTPEGAEPAPAEKAAAGEGRGAAPMGAEGERSESKRKKK